MRTNKVDSKIWHEEVKKYKNACQELGRTIKCTELKHKFMGLKCYSWYPENAPDELNICSFTDFLNYLGESVYYEVRPTKEYVINYVKDLQLKLNRSLKLSDFDNDKNVKRCDILHYFGSFNNMNNELGFKETGTYKGHTYSKEELKDMQNYSTEKIQIGDKEVTRYEASQLMRQLETQMRYKKDEIITLRTAGCEYKKESQRLRDLQKQYNVVSKASGLKKRYERAYVPGFK